MLYKKNCENSLSAELFAAPTSEYRGAPFWSWNCKLNEDLLRRQIGYLKEMGFGGFHMHSRVGMASEYLGEEFMHMISSCVDEAKKQNMLAWLYDEDKWPSGYGGGFVTANPEFVQRLAVFTADEKTLPEFTDKDTAVATEGSYLLGCYDIVLNASGELCEYRPLAKDEKANGTKWYVYCTVGEKRAWLNNTIYVDTLNKDAIDKFIEITHCRYKEVVGEDFGDCIPAIFSDEPKFWMKGNLKMSDSQCETVKFPWTYKLPELFKESTGLDVFEFLPELVWQLPEGRVSRFRYVFHDFITELFVSSFVDNIGSWCEENGIMMTGHLMREDNLNIQTDSIGEAMRGYRGFQLPGIDTLIDNTLSLYNAAKQAQSASRQYGREGVLGEMYGVTGWDFDFRRHKFQGDWEAAFGVTVRVPHLSWVSMAGESKRDFPSTFNYQSPWYKEYKYIEDHFARVNTAMTRGVPDVKIGVVHPIESCWIHYGPVDATSDIRKHLDDCFANLCQWLMFGTLDFDYISESLLPSLHNKQSSEKFNVGKMDYSVILVPVVHTLRKTTIDALYDFAKKGGRVIFACDCPSYTDAVESDYAKKLYDISEHINFSEFDIIKALEPYRDIQIKLKNGETSKNIIYNMRCDNDCKWLFVTHGDKNYGARFDFAKYNDINAPLPEDVTIKIKGEYIPYLYDTLSGNISIAEHSYKSGCTYVYHTMYSESSILLKLVQGNDEGYISSQSKKEQKQIVAGGMCDYILEEPNVLLLDTAQFALNSDVFESEEEILRIDDICRSRLGFPPKSNMAQPWTVEDTDYGHKVKLRFCINSHIELDDICIGAEYADLLSIEFNGNNVPLEAEGYYVDESIKKFRLPHLNKGTNILVLTLKLTERSNIEACYLLGKFGVRLEGSVKTVVQKPQKIGFSPLKMQNLPFYSGNIVYIKDIDLPDCDISVRTPVYSGAAVKVYLDGKDCGNSSLAPNVVNIPGVSKGLHKLEIKLFGNRYNTFGPLHNTVDSQKWLGSNVWRTEGDAFCYEYRVRDFGILAAPTVTVYEL